MNIADPVNLEQIENMVAELPAASSLQVEQSEIFEPDQPAPIDEIAPPAAPVDALISESAFLEQWYGVHDMAGGMVQMRSGQPCPLGDQARNDGGQLAGKAVYGMIARNPTLSKLMLSESSGFWGEMMFIGMHGFSCVQMVKASLQTPMTASVAMPEPEPEPEPKDKGVEYAS